MPQSQSLEPKIWSDTILQTLKDNDVRLIAYGPDNVLTPLIQGVTTVNYFMAIGATREDEALGIVAGAWMGGIKGCMTRIGVMDSGLALRGVRNDRSRNVAISSTDIRS